MRVVAALAALAAAVGITIAGIRSSAASSPPVRSDPAEPAQEPAALPPVEPPPAGRISPAEVVRLAAAADPDGWMPLPDLLAFVEIESSFRPMAYRYEPARGEASYGLMQVLESTARDRGLMGSPEQLYDPATGLAFGIEQARWSYEFLARRLGREPTTAEWVGSYNAGVGNVLRGFIPQGYVRRWELARARYAVVA